MQQQQKNELYHNFLLTKLLKKLEPVFLDEPLKLETI